MALSGGSKIFLLVMLIAGVLVGGAVSLLGEVGAPAGDGQPVTVEIPEGASASQVAELLAEEGVLDSPLIFKLVARFDDRAGRIRPGVYELRPGMSSGALLGVLSSGPPAPPTFRVTIPEGLTVDQSLERIAGAPSSPFTVEELQTALDGVALPEWVPLERLPGEAQPYEGLLFPDTYEFRVDADAQQVVARLVAQTDQVLAQIEPPEGFDRYQLLTAASLIEREARIADERPLISAVIHNRLDAGMPLQVDATVLYALGDHKDRVLYSDLEVDSPWNTYKVAGLPPTPISGAGRSAIRAAAEPAPESYLYYVVSDPATGAHAFAATASEHEENVRRYREGQAG